MDERLHRFDVQGSSNFPDVMYYVRLLQGIGVASYADNDDDDDDERMNFNVA